MILGSHSEQTTPVECLYISHTVYRTKLFDTAHIYGKGHETRINSSEFDVLHDAQGNKCLAIRIRRAKYLSDTEWQIPLY